MKYLNTLRNQILVARGWMFATVVFALIAAWLAIQLGAATANMPTRLVPYNFDTLDGPVEVTNEARSSEKYLTRLALADLQLYTDWTPQTVEDQFGRFQNRMAPSLYAKKGSALASRAEELADAEGSQSLFVEDASASDGKVRIDGVLHEWQGQERVEDKRVRYELRYTFSGGTPYLEGFRKEER